MEKIENNEELQTVFQIQDPDEVMIILIRELNAIIEEIALSRIVQVTNRHKPLHDEEGEELLKYANEQLSKAIQFNEIKVWRYF